MQRDGAITEYITSPRSNLYPADLTLRELCLVEPLTVGFHAIARGRVTAGDTVAVLGCGGIGLGAIAASAFRGANAIAIDMDAGKLEIARKAGAQHLIDAKTKHLHTRLQDIMGSRNALPEDFREVIRMLEAGNFPVDEAISFMVPIKDAARMLSEWSTTPEMFTKILVQIS